MDFAPQPAQTGRRASRSAAFFAACSRAARCTWVWCFSWRALAY
ncbi:hypothetical protein [Streptomyces sp. NPDC015345]